MPISTPPTHHIIFPEQIQCFSFCSFDFATSLVCVAVDKKLTLGIIHFPEEMKYFDWERLKNIYHGSRCDALAFAPETSTVSIPKIVTFCAAGGDFLLRIFRTDLQSTDTIQVLNGHTNSVNDIAWQTDGYYLASVSDDYSCKIWNAELKFESVTTFCLSSAGMSVKWHAHETTKVLVAEKRGLIHLYNVCTQQVIISMEAPKSPLMSADWSLMNHFQIAALACDLVSWDLRRPSTPLSVKQVHENSGEIIKYSLNSETIMASIGRPETTLKVYSTKSSVNLIEFPLKQCSGIEWHPRLSYIAAASDRKLYFWRVQNK